MATKPLDPPPIQEAPVDGLTEALRDAGMNLKPKKPALLKTPPRWIKWFNDIQAAVNILIAAGGGGSGTVTHTVGPLTLNQLVLGNGAADIKVLGSLGTVTTVYHGNAAGAGSFGPVVLTTDVSGLLPVANGGTGTAAPGLIAGTNITSITGAWPNQTINAAFGTFFTETLVTAAPNGTINEIVLALTGGTASDDMVLTPKGASGGFHLGAPADNTSTGGNKRGVRAVDFQLSRSTAAQVASGQASFAAGASNLVSGITSGAIGTGNIVSATSAMAFGGGNTADGTGSTAVGLSSSARGCVGVVAGAAGFASGVADRQWRIFDGRGQTNDAATAVVLTSDGNTTASTANTLCTPTSICLFTFTALVCGMRVNGDYASFKIEGLCVRPGGVGTTAVTATTTTLGTLGTGATCTCTAVANLTTGGFQIQVTGFAAATQGQWNCTIICSELKV